MNVEDLRDGFARLAEPVVPVEDPYGRLLGRRRRRRTALSATGVGLALAGLLAVAGTLPGAGGADRAAGRGTGYDASPRVGGSPPPSPGTTQPPSAIKGEWVRRLLDSPTRGNLAGQPAVVEEIRRGYGAARAELLVPGSLSRVRVLFAHDTPTARMVVVAFTSPTQGVLRTAITGPNAPVAELLRSTATPDVAEELTPHVGREMVGRRAGGQWVDGFSLAPAGCRVWSATGGRLGPDGTVRRSWSAQPMDGYYVHGSGTAAARWRMTCDGVVRYEDTPNVGTVRWGVPATPTPPPGTGPAVAAEAAQRLRAAMTETALAPAPVATPWAGTLPGSGPGDPPVAVVSACHADGGCAVLAQAGTRAWAEAGTSGLGQDNTWTALGVPGLTAVPLATAPGPADRVLVLAPAAAQVSFLDRKEDVLARRNLSGGSVVVPLRDVPPGAVRIAVATAGGDVLATVPLNADQPRVVGFAERWIQNW